MQGRPDTVARLIKRDGATCQYPNCGGSLDTSIDDGPLEVTIDHWIPQWYGKQEGWAYEAIWDMSNLKLMHKKCNAKKGDLIPLEDGTLPKREMRTFKYRRDKRAQRAEICTACNAGRNLSENEWCQACGSGPMPERFPKWRQMNTKDCDHDLFFCVNCTVWDPDIRRTVIDTLLHGGKGYEDESAEE